MQTLAQRVAGYIRKHELLQAGARVGVAVSGGADSVALLRLLLELRKELGIVLTVVHFDHKLRGPASEADEQFVAELAKRHRLYLHRAAGDVAAHASARHLSVEAAARELRYEFFRQLLLKEGLDRVATGHSLDDQAETVLLRIARGAGSRGLAGIYPRVGVFGTSASGLSQGSPAGFVVRPLLAIRRRDLEAYLKSIGQPWREDATNLDLRYTRNRVRHEVLPVLEQHLGPQTYCALAETAEIARAEEEYWQNEVARILPTVLRTGPPGHQEVAAVELDLPKLLKLPLALQRRILRAAAESLGLRLASQHVEESLQVALGSAKSADWPDRWSVSNRKSCLRIERRKQAHEDPRDYEYPLPVPGEIEVAETGVRFATALVPKGELAGYNSEDLLDVTLVGKELRIRNWRPGDRFWPARTKSPKKIKELLQERHVSGDRRKLWPVVMSGSEIIWVPGFSAPARLRARDGADAVLISVSPSDAASFNAYE